MTSFPLNQSWNHRQLFHVLSSRTRHPLDVIADVIGKTRRAKSESINGTYFMSGVAVSEPVWELFLPNNVWWRSLFGGCQIEIVFLCPKKLLCCRTPHEPNKHSLFKWPVIIYDCGVHVRGICLHVIYVRLIAHVHVCWCIT